MNIYQNIQKKIGKKKNIKKKCQNKCRVILKDKTNVENGINQKKEKNGIVNMLKEVFYYKIQKKEYVNIVKKNIFQKSKDKNIVVKLVQEKEIKNKEEKEQRIKAVYNITVEGAGCYYANGILVSNCDSLASIFTNVLGCAAVGKARSSMSREDLGI